MLLNVLRLAHKYGMSSIEVAQQESVKLPLTALVDGRYDETSSSLVLDIANVGQECECQSILVSCEAFVVKHFQAYASSHHREMLSKLSSASLLRVSQGLVQSYEAAMQTSRAALASYADESKLWWKFKYENMCPRCHDTISAYRDSSFQHDKKGSTCTWPAARVIEQRSVKASSMASILAKLAQGQD